MDEFKDVVINDNWVILKRIGSGSFGQVFTAINIKTQVIAAVKVEQTNKNEQLAYESKIISSLQGGTGIPKLHWYGVENSLKNYVIMIIEMLGPSLEDLYANCHRKFSLKTVLMIADQMISRIEYIHRNNYVHRDMKPDNFLMGLNDKSHHVYLIDFGLSKKFRDQKTLHHAPYKENKNLTGTARYASIQSHLGIEQARRDDLESIGYLLIYFLKGTLPWQKMKANNKQEKYFKIQDKKMNTVPDIMCKGLPHQIVNFIQYARTLQYEDKPDYAFWRKSFRELFISNGYELDWLYDWTNPDLVNFNHQTPQNKLQVNLNSLRNRNNGKGNLSEDLTDSIFKAPKEGKSTSDDNKSNQVEIAMGDASPRNSKDGSQSDICKILEANEIEENSQC